MNRDRIQGVGRQFIGRLKQRWGRLCDDPGAVAAGTTDCIVGRIREQRGVSKELADRQLAEFLRRNRHWWNLPGR